MEGYIANEHFYKLSDGPVINTVHFIGSGYQSVMHLHFKGVTTENVFELAKEWYTKTGQTFKYCNEFEREEWTIPKNPVVQIDYNFHELTQEVEA